MAEKWRKFNEQIAAKKKGKKVDKRDNIVVQRLSASVSGKAQKYTRVGPREFVEFDEEADLSIDAIKAACLKHFRPQIGEHMTCDVLAGEQGPSCSHAKQIPNLKLIHVRFIEDDAAECVLVKDEANKSNPTRRKRNAVSHPSPKKAKNDTQRTTIPKSLSISTILKLGRVIDTSSTLVNLYSFDLESMKWSTVPTPVEFQIATEVLGEDAFRKAFKAEATTKEFASQPWVVKRYNDRALDEIRGTNQTIENHTKKVVQMHSLARNFGLRLESEVKRQGLEDKFGKMMHYNNIYLGKLPTDEVVSIEEYVEGDMAKFINNDGIPCPRNPLLLQEKAECLAHFSYDDSSQEVMLVDIQGVEYSLFDPEIASTKLTHVPTDPSSEVMFTTGNLSTLAIQNFCDNHSCNSFCKYLGLKSLQ